jgi:hypothetical protein
MQQQEFHQEHRTAVSTALVGSINGAMYIPPDSFARDRLFNALSPHALFARRHRNLYRAFRRMNLPRETTRGIVVRNARAWRSDRASLPVPRTELAEANYLRGLTPKRDWRYPATRRARGEFAEVGVEAAGPMEL